MADTTQNPPPIANGGTKSKPSGPRPPNRHQQLNKLYALPAPLRTFPLPTLVPHNPISLFHVLYVWLSQTIKPESAHFDPLYQGWFSPETRSIHVTDPRAIRGLWEQGFYGKGSLSRSEPSWLKREKTRRGTKEKTTSEEMTRQRRAERQKTKWERARKEREAIDQTLSEEAEAVLEQEVQIDEAQLTFSDSMSETTIVPESEESPSRSWIFVAPVDPMKLLALPNSTADLLVITHQSLSSSTFEDDDVFTNASASPVGPLELLSLPEKFTYPQSTNGHVSASTTSDLETNGKPNGLGLIERLMVEDNEVVGGSETNEDTAEGSTHSEDTVETTSTAPTSAMANGSPSTPKMKRQKSVRFSPTVERNTFIQSEPPSPQHGKVETPVEKTPLVIKEQEHTQLTLEEAFFLSYGLGALEILDPTTKSPIPQQNLFKLFRQTSYFPPTANPTLAPDDPFMMNYIAYHHYRSLGWVPRSGVKFSVDLMLYVRGPVFTHAEFGVLILPSYSDPYWSSTTALQKYANEKEKRTWAWISCINRVITQVKKTLILTYVDVPPPLEREVEDAMGVNEVLKRYKVREVVMKRWIANRSRD